MRECARGIDCETWGWRVGFGITWCGYWCAVAEWYLPHACTFIAGSVHYNFTVGGGYCDGCGSEVGCASFFGELGEGKDGVAEVGGDVCLDGADAG